MEKLWKSSASPCQDSQSTKGNAFLAESPNLHFWMISAEFRCRHVFWWMGPGGHYVLLTFRIHKRLFLPDSSWGHQAWTLCLEPEQAIGPLAQPARTLYLEKFQEKSINATSILSGTPNTKGNRIGHFADFLDFLFYFMKSMDFQLFS